MMCLLSDQCEFVAVLWILICGLVHISFLSLIVNFSIVSFLLLPLH